MTFLLRKTITETFLERARLTPELVAFQYRSGVDWTGITFRRFFELCRDTSFGLMSLGLKPGEKVALISSSRFEWPVSDMAILGARAVTVPIYPSVTGDEIQFILDHCEARIAIVENASQLRKLLQKRDENPKALPHLRQIIVMDTTAVPAGILSFKAVQRFGKEHAERDPAAFEAHLAQASPGDVFTICYTSGTTGDPKGVMLTHDNLMSVLEDCVQVLGKLLRPEQEVTLTLLPYAHILGRVESMAIHVFGWRSAFAESPDRFSTNLREIRPTLIFTVPRIFEKAFDRVNATVARSPGPLQTLYQWALTSGKAYFQAVWAGKRPRLLDAAQYQLARAMIFDKVRDGFGGRLRCAI
ncbi:MAG: AMP-binding protein, partial [Oligoflexia bacterium]|nr:AMP-binding protein [Oligoflexia bacterium]